MKPVYLPVELPPAPEFNLDHALEALSVVRDEWSFLYRQRVTMRDVIRLLADEIDRRSALRPKSKPTPAYHWLGAEADLSANFRLSDVIPPVTKP